MPPGTAGSALCLSPAASPLPASQTASPGDCMLPALLPSPPSILPRNSSSSLSRSSSPMCSQKTLSAPLLPPALGSLSASLRLHPPARYTCSVAPRTLPAASYTSSLPPPAPSPSTFLPLLSLSLSTPFLLPSPLLLPSHGPPASPALPSPSTSLASTPAASPTPPPLATLAATLNNLHTGSPTPSIRYSPLSCMHRISLLSPSSSLLLTIRHSLCGASSPAIRALPLLPLLTST